VCVAYLRNKLALHSRLRSLNLKTQFFIFDIFRVHTNDFLKVLGVKVGVANFTFQLKFSI